MSNRPASDSLILQTIIANWPLLKTLVLAAFLGAGLYWLILEFRAVELYESYLAKLTQLSSALVSIAGIDHGLQQAFLINHYDAILTDTVGVKVIVNSDYDGLVPLAMLLALVIAWPGAWVRKAPFLLLATTVLLGFAAMRIAAEVFCDQHFPLIYDSLHLLVIPSATILFPMLIIFLLWVYFSDKRPIS